MKSYKLIYQLINLVENLEEGNPGRELSILDFAGFLNQHLQERPPAGKNSKSPFGKSEGQALELANQLDNNIGRLISFLSRYAKYYIKKALEGTPLLSAEDFSCLGILLTHEHLSKSDLIILNVQEKTSGTQVIDRLIAAGLAAQWDDPADKRGKRVAITDKGRKLLYLIFKDTNNVGIIMTGALTKPEKLTLLYLLQKLDHYHYQAYENKTVIKKEDLKVQARKITGKSI